MKTKEKVPRATNQLEKNRLTVALNIDSHKFCQFLILQDKNVKPETMFSTQHLKTRITTTAIQLKRLII